MVTGERLTRGWVPLLRLLAAVPERGGTDAIKLGFQSVELMCSDYMAALPVEQLRRCLEVAAMYANQQVPAAAALLQCRRRSFLHDTTFAHGQHQTTVEAARVTTGRQALQTLLAGALAPQEDLNVTLTAISQLWNAADFLARLPHPDSGGSSGAAAGQQHGGVDRSQYADLLEILFNALQVSWRAARQVQAVLHLESDCLQTPAYWIFYLFISVLPLSVVRSRHEKRTSEPLQCAMPADVAAGLLSLWWWCSD